MKAKNIEAKAKASENNREGGYVSGSRIKSGINGFNRLSKRLSSFAIAAIFVMAVFLAFTAVASATTIYVPEGGNQTLSKAETEEQLLASLALGSLIPNTMLQNFEKNGAFTFETPYILNKKWTKGDKYDGNKRAKGHGWGVDKVKLPTSILDKMIAWHNSAMNVVETDSEGGEDTPAQEEAPAEASGVKM